MSLHCPSDVPRLSLIQPQAKLTHRQQSVHTPGSRTAPPSSCLQLIKPRRLNTATHHLYQLQIQPHLQLIKSQQLLAPQEKCTDNPSAATALPSLYHMGNHPPAAHAGPAHRLDEVQTREQHTQVKLSENSDSESSANSAALVMSFTSRWLVDNSASPHPWNSLHHAPTTRQPRSRAEITTRSSQPSFRSRSCHRPQAWILPHQIQPQVIQLTHITPPVLTAEQAFPHLP